nr:helix-turn-helix transcriptional regulator [Leucobacter ruminantium]
MVPRAWVEHASAVPKIHSEAALKIGRRVRSVRQRLGISLEDLGELSEISWTSIGKIERGASSPTAETLVRIATALEVDPGSFLAGLTSDDYGRRAHRFSARDLIRGREQHAEEQRGA